MHVLARLAALLLLSLMLAAATAGAPASAAVPDAVVTAATDGTPATVVTTVPGQVGRIVFNVVEGQRIYIACSFQIPDSRIATALHGPAGTKLAGAYCNPQSATLYDTRSLGGGTHAVIVDPLHDLVGSFTARIFTVPADPAVAAATDGGPGTVVTTTPGQNSRIVFDVTAGQRIYIACSFQIPDSRIATALHGPAGTKLAGAWCNPQGLTLYDTRELVTSGTHSIMVDPFNDRVGAFTVRVFAVPADPTLAAADGQPVRVETTTPGQNATIAVAGVQGRALGIEVGERTYAVRGCVRTTLTSPTGARVWLDPCTGAGVKLTPVLPASGVYLLRVDPADLETGGATFTVTPA